MDPILVLGPHNLPRRHCSFYSHSLDLVPLVMPPQPLYAKTSAEDHSFIVCVAVCF